MQDRFRKSSMMACGELAPGEMAHVDDMASRLAHVQLQNQKRHTHGSRLKRKPGELESCSEAESLCRRWCLVRL